MVGLWGANTSYGGPVGGKHVIGFQRMECTAIWWACGGQTRHMVGLWGANTSLGSSVWSALPYGGPVGGKHVIGFQRMECTWPVSIIRNTFQHNIMACTVGQTSQLQNQI